MVMSAPQSEVLQVEIIASDGEDTSKGSIALVTINRPNKLNALNSDVMESIKKCASGLNLKTRFAVW